MKHIKGEPRPRSEAERKLRAAIKRLPADARRAIERSMASAVALPSPCEEADDDVLSALDIGSL